MTTPETESEFREEVKKEFQLERMILFSDAVFAIVITLMAIEIKLPEAGHEPLSFGEMAQHLAPVILAYIVSFFFIGAIWYQHLRIFSLLKTYDKGLVVRNLALLFCIGLFPFGATVIAHGKGSMTAFFVYVAIIFLCLMAQFFIHYYILVQRPALRTHASISKYLQDLHKRKVALVSFLVAIVLIVLTNMIVDNPVARSLSMLWALLMPISIKLFKRKTT